MSLPQEPGGPRPVRARGGRSCVPPCVRPRRKWPGNGSRLLRLVVFETSFLIRSRHAPGASRCHRAGGGPQNRGGPSFVPGEWHRLHGTDSSPQPAALSPPAQLLGTVLAPVSPRGSQGPAGAAATGFDTGTSVAATLAVPGVTGVRVSPGLGVTHHHRGSRVPPSRGSCPSPSSPRPAPVSCRGPVFSSALGGSGRGERGRRSPGAGGR